MLHGTSCLERRSRFRSFDLRDVPDGEVLHQYYEEAIAFKLRPSHECPAGHTLVSWHEEVTRFYGAIFLWFERQRLADPGLTWDGYQRRSRRLPYSGLYPSLLNLIRNLRIRTTRWPRIHELFLHPRDRVLANLPGLLLTHAGDERISADVLRLWQYCG